MTDSTFVEGGSIGGGKIKIDKLIRAGGEGTVFTAHDPKYPHTVAVKVVNAKTPEELAKARKESKLVMSLGSHPHRVSVLDRGEEGGISWHTMEKADASLYDVMKSENIPFEGTIIIVRQIASVLEDDHSHGVIHRDLKPQNILIKDWKKGIYAKLADYGIAFRKDPMQETKADEPSGNLAGTAPYMSPEAILNRACGKRSDQYSLAVMTYHMLTGQLPFKGDMLQIASQHKKKEDIPKFVDTIKRDLTTEEAFILSRLEPIVRKGMSYNIEDRYNSVTEYANELEKEFRTARYIYDLEKEVKQALSNSERLKIYYTYGLKLNAIGAKSEAAKAFEEIIKIPATNSYEYVMQAYALSIFQRNEDALKACELAQMQDDIDTKVYPMKAHIWERLNNYHEAAANYLRAIEYYPQNAALLLEAGKAMEKIGQYDYALQFYIRSFNSNNNSIESLQYARQLNELLGRKESVASIDRIISEFEDRKQRETGESAEISEKPTLVMSAV